MYRSPSPTILSNSSSLMRNTVTIQENGYLLGAVGALFDF